ncbi:peptidylprolyl isomerase [Falsirhodobacter deserti]|uniref:peptidylprolyl isomerase n=1 Tax=Falsirhodobacter deserti TaxID=1365611 RepID=UPI000FE2EDF4|nr:peptidylprolyl isomerase [Falsirhodobacter deserti]
MHRYTLPLLAAALIAGQSTPVLAQNLFAPNVIVNGSAVTEWELQQRIRFLTLLRAPGDIPQVAKDGLIEDRLRLDAARQAGITVSDAEIEDGMVEFAQRADLTAEQFISQIEAAGVDRATFRAFVEAGVLWRYVVRGRFANRVVINDADIDRAVEAQRQAPNIRVLLSEVILPVPPGQEAQALAAAEDIVRRVEAGANFAEFARQYSASRTADNGGALEWLSLAELPPGLQPVFLGLDAGGVTQPLQLPNAIAIFQLRAKEESAPTQRPTEVDYALYPLPAANAAEAAATVTARADTCNDLYAAARRNGVPVQRGTQAESQLPANLAPAIARLDQYESAVVNGSAPSLVMLCARRPIQDQAVDRDAIRQQLTNQQLNALATVYLSQLRDNAIIRTP